MKLLLNNLDGVLRVIPDSAIGRTSQPWFVPDFGHNWTAHYALAARIGRLGKGISPKYAERYIDGVTLLWVPESKNGGVLADFMDGAVVCGLWIPPLPEHIDAFGGLLHRVSEFATLKTGDVIANIISGQPQAVVRDTHISKCLNGKEVLSFNVK